MVRPRGGGRGGGSTRGLGRFADAHAELRPIDHGFCLPEALEPPFFEWLHWPQAREPQLPLLCRCVYDCSGLNSNTRPHAMQHLCNFISQCLTLSITAAGDDAVLRGGAGVHCGAGRAGRL